MREGGEKGGGKERSSSSMYSTGSPESKIFLHKIIGEQGNSMYIVPSPGRQINQMKE